MARKATLIMFLTVAAMFLWLAALVYTSAYGIAFLAGRILGTIAILGIPAAIISKVRRRPVRFDIVFGMTAIVLAATSYREVIATIDERQFASELKAAGSDKFAQVVQNSQTSSGALFRTFAAAARDTQARIQPILTDLSDPIFEGLFLPPKVTDRRVLLTAFDTVGVKRQKITAALSQIDEQGYALDSSSSIG